MVQTDDGGQLEVSRHVWCNSEETNWEVLRGTC